MPALTDNWKRPYPIIDVAVNPTKRTDLGSNNDDDVDVTTIIITTEVTICCSLSEITGRSSLHAFCPDGTFEYHWIKGHLLPFGLSIAPLLFGQCFV